MSWTKATLTTAIQDYIESTESSLVTNIPNFIKSTEGLDWSSIANITGDLATLKRTIQTLNNRMNGMHSPKVQEQEIMMQLLKNQQNNPTYINGKANGG